jgi:UDP:flavonoid glycosyltransferase YjiC (YdhE family)
VFGLVAPLTLRLHAIPMERLRAHFGLPSLGYDLRRCYTDADMRLFANFPALFPEVKTSPTADFIGPIAWSPPERTDLGLPQKDTPLIYVTMGSSGDPKVLATLIPVLERSGAQVVVATAGKPLPAGCVSESTRVFDFLPGDQLCRHASLVVCNGGSPTTNQALSHGVPVLGIASNMDQFLNMGAIADYGAGLLVRADRAHAQNLHRAVDRLIQDGSIRSRAQSLSKSATSAARLPDLAAHLHRLHDLQRRH